MTDSPIFRYNELTKSKSGVWQLKNRSPFNYSDSDEVEENIKNIIENCDDRGSLSIELEGKIFNWASEYHLSSQRTNLFRFLDLGNVETMLELGCGCGANTRFLGESGIRVDAIEGSERRSQITRKRCEGIGNVNVICSNFNDLTYPENSYDCVSFIGVLEYSKKYNEEAIDDDHAIHEILSKAKLALKDKGLLIISIENRMGLKYWLGASEDHLGRPYAGIYGYPGNSGVKTYTKREWEQILKSIGFKYYRFCHPFPDYKLPRLLVSDHFLHNEPYAYSLLYRVASRDYDQEWHPEPNEFLIWKSLCESGDIEFYSNSFLMVASSSSEYLNGSIPYDFMQFPDLGRKPYYRVITYKPRDSSYVYKKRMIGNKEHLKNDKTIFQNESDRSDYKKGELLSSVWLMAMEERSNKNYFFSLIKEYYSYLQNVIKSSDKSCKYLDLLPSNIIVDKEGKLHIIDQEWTIKLEITPEFILFRALFWFTVHNKYTISNFIETIQPNTTVNGFIELCFVQANIKVESFDHFMEIEREIHNEINIESTSDRLEKMLNGSLTYEEDKIFIAKEEANRKIEYISNEIEKIKNSKIWRLAVFYRLVFYDKLLGHFPLLQKSALFISREGFRPFLSKAMLYVSVKAKFLSKRIFRNDYDKWRVKNEVKNSDIPDIREKISKMNMKPLISVIMPVYNVEKRWLELAIQSVTNQIYDKWELCIVDDASTMDHIKESIQKYENNDDRIRVKYLKNNQGISGASNEALSIATGDFIALLDHDDELSIDALYEVAKLINTHPDAQMIYSDEDMIDRKGRRMNPYFKPGWSPDTLLSGNYITHLSVYKKSIVDAVGGFRKGYEGSQDFDLALRFTEKASKIYHIPKILYHWRRIEGSVAASYSAKNYAYDNAKKALEDTMERRKIKGKIEFGHGAGYYVMRRHIDNSQLVSVIVCSLKPGKLIDNLIASIEKKTIRNNFEILIPVYKEGRQLDNLLKTYSSCRIIRSDVNLTQSTAYNLAAKYAKGRHLVFLEDNLEVISPHWLSSLIEHSQRPEIGVVGAKILCPDKKTVEHAGIILGVTGIAGNAYKKSNDYTMRYFGHLNIIKNYSAVSNSCMMIKNRLFQDVGGFDEKLPFAYNDIDLCLKIKDKGLSNIYTPFSVLAKQENKSGIESSNIEERRHLLEKWGEVIQRDPFYNPNLTLSREDFSVRTYK